MQVGNHLDQGLDLPRQCGTVIVQLGVGCHVLGLSGTKPIDEAAFTERVATLGETASVRSALESPAYRVRYGRIWAPHGERAHLTSSIFSQPRQDLSGASVS